MLLLVLLLKCYKTHNYEKLLSFKIFFLILKEFNVKKNALYLIFNVV
jgi:hypothetical protein